MSLSLSLYIYIYNIAIQHTTSTILYYTILYYTILYYTILYYTILYCIVALLYYIINIVAWSPRRAETPARRP